MRNVLLRLRFDGRAYHGWQIQKNAVTVQEVLQKAQSSVHGSAPPIKGCSRTDAGVHALEFCVSMPIYSNISCSSLVRALNVNLPESIAVLSCSEVDEEFHARYSVKYKRYLYRIWNSPVRDPFAAGLALHWPARLDEKAMEREAQAFLGTHDFSAFCASGSSVEDKVRTVTEYTACRNGDMIELRITADGFLYNMVRIITGTLIDVERGRLESGSIADIIDSRDRKRAGFTAPPDGLYLEEVIY